MQGKSTQKAFDGCWLYFLAEDSSSSDPHSRDVYLKPDIRDLQHSLLLTIDALGGRRRKGETSEEYRWRQEALTRLNGRGFALLEDNYMYIKDVRPSEDRLRYWARVWLDEQGYLVTELSRALSDLFRSTIKLVDRVECTTEPESETTRWDVIEPRLKRPELFPKGEGK